MKAKGYTIKPQADLYGADLRWANIYRANIYRADLRGADFREATLQWASHNLISEILRQHANTTRQFMLAGFVAVRLEDCWKDFLGNEELPEKDWALSVLKTYAKTEDINVPRVVLETD